MDAATPVVQEFFDQYARNRGAMDIERIATAYSTLSGEHAWQLLAFIRTRYKGDPVRSIRRDEGSRARLDSWRAPEHRVVTISLSRAARCRRCQ
jgi:hypothetical protein